MTDSVEISTRAGRVRGRVEGVVRVWRGVPYAAPPIGEQRWRSPHPVSPWQGVRAADHFGQVCPQPPSPVIDHGPGAVQGEDCLTLNVWAPARPTERPRPVLVWVHGGAYLLGSSRQPLYDSARLASEGDLVVVTVNYRVGALGWLDLRRAAPALGADANLGLRDVVAALEWVRDEIAAFGGDPGQVTLAGESAGGGIVTTLLTTPATAGLFHRAIVQSSPVTSVHSARAADVMAERFLAEVGTTDPRALRALPAGEVERAGTAIYHAVPVDLPGRIAFAPVVDGELVVEPPAQVLQTGRAHPVPLLLGTNRDEASAFRFMKSPLMPITPSAVRRMFDEMAPGTDDVPNPTMAQVVSAYRQQRSRSLGLDLARDIGFRMPTVWAALGHRRVAPVHLYRFDAATPLFRVIGLGATHGTELPYLFGTFGHADRDPTFVLGGRRTARWVGERMRRRWAAFVRGEAPDAGPDAPPWPRYDEAEQSLLLNTRDTVVTDLDGPLRRAWGDRVLAFD